MSSGKEYELFVQQLMQAIIDSENQGGQKNISVRHNEKLEDRFGVERQFDVLWDYEQGGITYKTIIECKDYNSAVSIEKIDALIGKLYDFPNVRGIIATTKGYQSGAKEKAKHNGIELLCIRKQNDSDWINEDGQPLMKKLHLDLTLNCGPSVENVSIAVDKEWGKKNDFSSLRLYENPEEILITYDNNQKKLSDEIMLIATNTQEYNKTIEKSKEYSNAFITGMNNCHQVKIKKINVRYSISKPIHEIIEINGADYILGVVEYLLQNKKTTVFNDTMTKIIAVNNNIGKIVKEEP